MQNWFQSYLDLDPFHYCCSAGVCVGAFVCMLIIRVAAYDLILLLCVCIIMPSDISFLNKIAFVLFDRKFVRVTRFYLVSVRFYVIILLYKLFVCRLKWLAG